VRKDAIMFAKALSSFSSPITANYTLSPTPHSTAGPWKIFNATRKSSAKVVSVFVFDAKTLQPAGFAASSSLGGGGGSAGSRRAAHDEVVERLRHEAAALARLRHPGILELVEPVEETRNGGLMFATEPVAASLAALLRERDERGRTAGESSGRSGDGASRYVVVEGNGEEERRREWEMDELEVQKGLLQLGRALEFLHESAGLVHANLTPEAVLVNAKGDWKIAGLAFCGPYQTPTSSTSSRAPINLGEMLHRDPRLPPSVQLDLDYTSPDFVLDHALAPPADMYSLGLLILALHNRPHTSPLLCRASLSTAKRLFTNPSSHPTPSNHFLLPRAQTTLPTQLASDLLPRLLDRHPAQRPSARDFQSAAYFDNLLMASLRFLDALPAKTPGEKAGFLRGLPRLAPQFPVGVLEKKVLPALLEEAKDRDLLAAVLSNVFAVVRALPKTAGPRAFVAHVVPKMREVFLPGLRPAGTTTTAAGGERDAGKDAGLMVLLENMSTAAENCQGPAFREDVLPIILLALESSTPALVDAALSTLPAILSVLDFSTIKNDLFPVVANVFAKTSSLNIKVRGLEAFYILCGGKAAVGDVDYDFDDDFDNNNNNPPDDLNGLNMTATKKKPTGDGSIAAAVLDKYTIQEKIVPLLRGIKTKEPGVMMAALRVFRQVAAVADPDFLALEVLPILWAMALGPLLDLRQFGAFMRLIRRLGGEIEREHARKLRELAGGPGRRGMGKAGEVLGVDGGGVNGPDVEGNNEVEFAALVSGRKTTAGDEDLMNDWVGGGLNAASFPSGPSSSGRSSAPTFAWQSAVPSTQTPFQQQRDTGPTLNALRSNPLGGRTVTPDQTLSAFAALTPTSPWSKPLQPTSLTASTTVGSTGGVPLPSRSAVATGGGIDWYPTSDRPRQMNGSGGGSGSGSAIMTGRGGRFALSPPPPPPPPSGRSSSAGLGMQAQPQSQRQNPSAKSGLDKYESLL